MSKASILGNTGVGFTVKQVSQIITKKLQVPHGIKRDV